jgi:hypothetical protein
VSSTVFDWPPLGTVVVQVILTIIEQLISTTGTGTYKVEIQKWFVRIVHFVGERDRVLALFQNIGDEQRAEDGGGRKTVKKSRGVVEGDGVRA